MEFENLLKLRQAVSDSELTGMKCEEKGVKLHLTKEKATIVTALQAAESTEDWEDKVTKITIEIPENSSVSAPYLDIVYSQKNPTNSGMAVWSENTQGYVY